MCKLSPAADDPVANYQGKIGDIILIGVRGTAGNAFIEPGTSYADQLLQDPWKFTLQAGIKRLLVFVANPVPDDSTVIAEVCDDGSRFPLLTYNYVPEAPQVSIMIKGIP